MKAFLVTSAGTFAGKPQTPFASKLSIVQIDLSSSLTPFLIYPNPKPPARTKKKEKPANTSSPSPPSAITAADSFSRSYERTRQPHESYTDAQARQRAEAEARKPLSQRALDWGRENRYGIVGGSWVASMGLALAIVGRNPYLTAPQKLVQARVYAQGLTVAVLIATAAFEISDSKGEKGRWEKVKVLDPEDPTHQRLVEREVHRESYRGEDQWRG